MAGDHSYEEDAVTEQEKQNDVLPADAEQDPAVEAQSGGTAEGEDEPLREEDVTREDALDDSVPEGDGL